VRPTFDPRQDLSVLVHDLGSVQVSRQDRDGRWVTTDERRQAMSVFVDDEEVIDAGLLISAAAPLVALHPCAVCELWQCNLVEGWAAKVRRFGPYVLWITPSGQIYTFAQDQYARELGPGAERLPALTPAEAWDLDDPDLSACYVGAGGLLLTVDGERDPEGPLAALRDWPACGAGDLRPVTPPAEAVEIRARTPGGPSIWIDRAPRVDGSRAAYLPSVTRARVWCVGPEIERLIAALFGLEPTPGAR
jgi:hypothetical protein